MFHHDKEARGQFARERTEQLARSARPPILVTRVDGRARARAVGLSPMAVREQLWRAFVARALVAGVARRAGAADAEDAQHA